MRIVIILIAFLLPALVYGQGAGTKGCPHKAPGWFFYCDEDKAQSRAPSATPKPPKKPPLVKKSVPRVEPRAASPARDKGEPARGDADDPQEVLKGIQKRLEFLRARAVIYPTDENVKAYIVYQSEQLERAARFSDVWRRVLWQNPELDYSLSRPTGELAKQTWLDQRRGDVDAALARLNERFGVFYFFRGQDCAPCATSAPIVAAFASKHGLNVLPVSLDGKGYKEFPYHATDTGQHVNFGIDVEHLPALVLYDSYTKRPVVISHGVVAADELAERIYALTQLGVGEDY